MAHTGVAAAHASAVTIVLPSEGQFTIIVVEEFETQEFPFQYILLPHPLTGAGPAVFGIHMFPFQYMLLPHPVEGGVEFIRQGFAPVGI